MTTVRFGERARQWVVPRSLGVGDVSHFYAEGVPVQHRGLLANRE